MPFDDLKSEEAQAKLSACRPASAFENHTVREGVPRYSPLGRHRSSRVVFRTAHVGRWLAVCRATRPRAPGSLAAPQCPIIVRTPRSHYGRRFLSTEDYADSCLHDGLHPQ